MSETDHVTRIILSFAIALVIVFITSKIVGEERKGQWFKKRQRNGFFSRRGIFGHSFYFGVPCKWQGFVVCFFMFGSISLISFLLLCGR